YVAQLSEAAEQLREASQLVDRLNALLPKGNSAEVDSLRQQGKLMQDSVKVLMNIMFADEDGKQGITDNPDVLSDQLNGLYNYLSYSPEAPNANQMLAMQQFIAKVKPFIARINRFFAEDWQAYRELAEATEWSPFEDVKPIGVDE
ncbi:MAG: hypothetical protein D6722_12640, partial [Bacteroidetes bacterium]